MYTCVHESFSVKITVGKGICHATLPTQIGSLEECKGRRRKSQLRVTDLHICSVPPTPPLMNTHRVIIKSLKTIVEELRT